MYVTSWFTAAHSLPTKLVHSVSMELVPLTSNTNYIWTRYYNVHDQFWYGRFASGVKINIAETSQIVIVNAGDQHGLENCQGAI